MPDIVMHASMGREVSEQLGLKLNDDVFRFGLLGPDPFLYCWPGHHRYSSVMHRSRTGAFLLELARSCQSSAARIHSQNRMYIDRFSYLAGFLCHYALDSLAHPLIVDIAESVYGKTKKASYLHVAIEHRLDLLAGGKAEIPPFPPETIRNMFEKSIGKVYGWKRSWRIMKNNYWHIRPFYVIVRDRFGIFHKILSIFGEKASMVTYHSKACDELDLSGFYPLYDKAVEDAVRFIRCAEDYIWGSIDEKAFKKVIGSRPYMPLT